MIAAFAWILSILGITITYIFLLGAAMSTVPQSLNLPTALGLALLPATVLIGAGWTFWTGRQLIGKVLLLYGVPCLLSLVTLFMIGTSVKLPRLGGPYAQYYGKNTDQPRYRFEIRAASLEPKTGYSEMRTNVGDPVTFYVADDVLFTHADLYSTSTYRESRNSETTITLGFHGGAQPRLQELSREMQGGYWAVLLDGELWLASRIREPLDRDLTLSAGFQAEDAADWAQGMVQE